MVGIVVVSHSEQLARGVVALAREMSPPGLALEAAGGIGEADVLGTSAELVREAIERAMSPDGVLVLMDLGSALMSAELAVELLPGASGPVLLSDAPLVEGTVAAAAAAGGGAALEEVAAEARRALAAKAAQIGPDQVESGEPASAVQAPAPCPPDAQAELLVMNEVGLHARPAARFVETVGAYDAAVLVARAGAAQPPANARSLTNVVALGARRGDRIRVLASGPQAAEVVTALQELAAAGFGDGVPAPAAGTVLRGFAAAAGVAVGSAWRLVPAGPATARSAGTPEQELARLDRGIEAAREALRRDRERLRSAAGDEEAAIFDAHLALLDDAALLEPASAAIAEGATAERAIGVAGDSVAATFRRLEDPLLAERATDVIDVCRRVIAEITGSEAAARPASGVVVADELTPSQSASFEPGRVTAIATARGSATSHAAIIARALGIPAVLGLGETILTVASGTRLLVDGDGGEVTVAPQEDAVTAVGDRREQARERAQTARSRANEPATLAGGERIEVYANIGSVEDARLAVECGAEGVGLLRTEFLYLERPTLPSEEEQAETLRRIAEALDGRPLVVRTLDAGADKPLPAVPLTPEVNPFLGVRGVRVGLRDPELLSAQLRAIMRVAAEHPLKLMVPMLATLGELEAVRQLIERAHADTGVSARPEVGIMVEVPAAALMAGQLAPHIDFFSIGTNDLTQYTMAAERGSAELAPLLAEPQPAVLALIQATVQAASAHGAWTGVCGEMAGDPACAALLIGLGVTELSMAPRLIPGMKQALRAVELGRAREVAQRVLLAASAAEARGHALGLL